MRILEPADLHGGNRNGKIFRRQYLTAIGGKSSAVVQYLIGVLARLFPIHPLLLKGNKERLRVEKAIGWNCPTSGKRRQFFGKFFAVHFCRRIESKVVHRYLFAQVVFIKSKGAFAPF